MLSVIIIDSLFVCLQLTLLSFILLLCSRELPLHRAAKCLCRNLRWIECSEKFKNTTPKYPWKLSHGLLIFKGRIILALSLFFYFHHLIYIFHSFHNPPFSNLHKFLKVSSDNGQPGYTSIFPCPFPTRFK